MQVETAIYRRDDVLKRVNFSRETLRRKVRDGSFPRPFRLGAQASGWKVEEIEEWLANLVRR